MNKENHNPTQESNKEEIICKNCDTSFVGQYCPNCGQHVKEIERPIRFMIVDFMGTFVSFDTRLVKTLVAILFKPGKLTQDFLDGKRARYMPPFRFYVFASFVMFLLISTVTGNSIKENMKDGINPVFNNNILENDSIELMRDSILQEVDKELEETLDSSHYQKYKTVTATTDTVRNEASKYFKGIEIGDDDSKYEETVKLVQEHPELFTAKLFQYTSWALFLFMPIFAFFLWILFYRSKSLYIGHLIFALNIHSFIFTITAIVIGIALLFPNQSTGWTGYLYLLTPLYQVIGARKLYQRKWINTFFKLTLVWFLYGIVWFAGLITLIVITFFVL